MCDVRCTCVPGPTGTFCGYIDRENGILHPCRPECCQPGCQVDPPSETAEYKQTRGIDLPPGFGQDLQTSDLPTLFKLESDFSPVGPTPEPAYHRRFFWLLFLVGVMVLMSLFLVG